MILPFLTTPYYVYRVVFHSRDLPEMRPGKWLSQFPRTDREVWVGQRQVRDALLYLDPRATYEKHEARKDGEMWYLGIQAQMIRDRQQQERINRAP